MRTSDSIPTVLVVILALVVVLALVAVVAIFGLGVGSNPNGSSGSANEVESIALEETDLTASATLTLTSTPTPSPSASPVPNPTETPTLANFERATVDAYVTQLLLQETATVQSQIETATAFVNATQVIATEATVGVGASGTSITRTPRFIPTFNVPLRPTDLYQTAVATLRNTQAPPPPNAELPSVGVVETPIPWINLVPTLVGVLNQNASLYQAPSVQSSVIRALEAGTAIDIAVEFGDWYYVSGQRLPDEGWTLRSHVRVLEASIAEPAIEQIQTEVIVTVTANAQLTADYLLSVAQTEAANVIASARPPSQTFTPVPSNTPRPSATNTPRPTVTNTLRPNETPRPANTLTPSATLIPTPSTGCNGVLQPSASATRYNPPLYGAVQIGGRVNVRAGFSTGYAILRQLQPGQLINVYALEAGWYSIGCGWVESNLIFTNQNPEVVVDIASDVATWTPSPSSNNNTLPPIATTPGPSPTTSPLCTNYGVTSPSGGGVPYTFDVRVCAPVGTTPTLIVSIDGNNFSWALDSLGNGNWWRQGVTLGVAPDTDCGRTFVLSVTTGGATATVTKNCATPSVSFWTSQYAYNASDGTCNLWLMWDISNTSINGELCVGNSNYSSCYGTITFTGTSVLGQQSITYGGGFAYPTHYVEIAGYGRILDNQTCTAP